MFKALTPNLLVADVDQSVEFYQLLGFEKLAQVPEQGKPQWALIRRDEVLIMLQERRSAEGELPFRYTQGQNAGALMYFDVENVEEIKSMLNGKVLMVKDIHSTFYGTNEMMVADPDHYLLIFAEDKK